MDKVEITKNEYERLKNRYENDRNAQLKYMKNFKQYSIKIPKNQANLFEQIAKKYNYRTARAMLQAYVDNLLLEEMQSIDKSIF